MAISITADGHSMLCPFVYTAPEEVRADEEESGTAADWQFMLQQRDIPCYIYLCPQLQKRSEQMKKSLEQQQRELDEKWKSFEREKAAWEEQWGERRRSLENQKE